MTWRAEANIYQVSSEDQRFMIGEKLVKTIRHHCIEFHLKSFTREGWVDMQELCANCQFLSEVDFVSDRWIRPWLR
jgi:RNA:NAD 2'-phosphotransferase (TPT1/KptA family)